jgi:hypothetical protein
MNFAQIKEHDRAADQVRAFMRRHKLAPADLIEVGGEDSSSPDSGKAERARHVGQCWQMMARLSIRFADLDHEYADH